MNPSEKKQFQFSGCFSVLHTFCSVDFNNLLPVLYVSILLTVHCTLLSHLYSFVVITLSHNHTVRLTTDLKRSRAIRTLTVFLKLHSCFTDSNYQQGCFKKINKVLTPSILHSSFEKVSFQQRNFSTPTLVQ